MAGILHILMKKLHWQNKEKQDRSRKWSVFLILQKNDKNRWQGKKQVCEDYMQNHDEVGLWYHWSLCFTLYWWNHHHIQIWKQNFWHHGLWCKRNTWRNTSSFIILKSKKTKTWKILFAKSNLYSDHNLKWLIESFFHLDFYVFTQKTIVLVWSQSMFKRMMWYEKESILLQKPEKSSIKIRWFNVLSFFQ